ncbi:hypothetical protein [Candidatus Carsonella ruddii]|uniref:Uncharacterized protein n=1 Tax=Candidatus Carsonella ruddii CE isolate Thao2000 TaxID=1202536 RepID=J7GST7_CARRU|nr:hypothetical protein [Candidatus Carsonella ruddii]AFP83539.1 hypothetical protein A33U_072 [Candidatus Carsonella ruddii CE isolate Thao2000]
MYYLIRYKKENFDFFFKRYKKSLDKKNFLKTKNFNKKDKIKIINKIK